MEDLPEQITIIPRPKYNKAIRQYSKEHNIPLNQIINKLIEDFINNVNSGT